MKNRIAAAFAAISCLLWVIGCSDNGNPSRPGMGHVVVHLTDAPGDYEAVNVVIRGVSVHRAGSEDEWESLALEGGTFDLLQLQNGVMTTLAIGDVPAGHYDQVRLLLGDGSTVVVDGVTYPLTVPSGMTSGLKLIGDFDVVEGEERELILDFDAAQSIHRTGNGKYMMRPTVRLIVGDVVVPPADTTGSITGRTLPEGVGATIEARQGGSAVRSTTNDSSGNFTLEPLLAGTYDVAIDAPDTLYRDTTITGVAVTAGQVTSLGDIQLQPADAPLVGSARASAVQPRR